MNLLSRIRALFRRDALDKDMNEELRSHIDMRTQENIASGMSPEQARSAALKQFGWVETVKNDCRDQRRFIWIDHLLRDIRYGARSLRKNPAFTAIAVVTLALGIGINSTIFSFLHAVLLAPLPFKSPDRLTYIWEAEKGRGIPRSTVSFADLLDWQMRATTLSGIAAFTPATASFSRGDDPVQANTLAVTPTYFDVLGIGPQLGRSFEKQDGEIGKHRVVVLSDGLWRETFGASADVIGKQVFINRQSFTVVGVMPRGASALNSRVLFWTPLPTPPNYAQDRSQRFLSVIARVRDGVSLSTAEQELKAIATTLAATYPENKGVESYFVSFEKEVFGRVKPALWTLMAAVGCVLLIACANLANLLLARGAARRREIAVCGALGATRARVFRQLITESILLSFIGGALGLLASRWGAELLRSIVGDQAPRAQFAAINSAVVWFTLAITVLTALVFGIIPALQLSRDSLNTALKENSRTSIGGGRRFREFLIIAEVAVALVLLVAAGLLVNSFFRLTAIETGLNSPQTLTFEVSLPDRIYQTDPQRIAFYNQFLDRARALPGVTAAGATLSLPLGGGGRYWTSFERENHPAPSRQTVPVINIQEITPGYLRAAGVSVIKGRDFTDTDGPDTPKVALISATLAKKHFGDDDPLGKRVRTDGNSPWFTIVGVVADIILDRVTEDPPPVLYTPHTQGAGGSAGSMVVAVRSTTDPLKLAEMIRGEIRSMDKNLPIASVATMQAVLHEAMGPARTNTVLLTTFAGLALFLAAIGVFGALSYSVVQRTAEIGLRKALGAPAFNVLSLIVRRGLALTGIGAVIGLLSSVALTHLMKSLLYGVSPIDPVTLAIVTVVLLAVAMIACIAPARRALMIEPSVALREE